MLEVTSSGQDKAVLLFILMIVDILVHGDIISLQPLRVFYYPRSYVLHSSRIEEITLCRSDMDVFCMKKYHSFFHLFFHINAYV